MERGRLILAVNCMAAEHYSKSAQVLVDKLGFTQAESAILIDVVSEAFAVSVLEQLGAFVSDEATAKTENGG